MITTVLNVMVWLVFVPFCMGLLLLPLIEGDKRTTGVVFLCGYMLMFSLFEVVTIPAIIFVKYDNFLVAYRAFTIVAGLAAIGGIVFSSVLRRRPDWTPLNAQSQKSKEELVLWLLFFVLLIFQIYMYCTRMSFDGDDAYYVAQSLTAVQNNSMYVTLPYTGFSTSLDLRHALAVFPMWIAFVAKACDIHSTILAHSVIGIVLIPLTYLIYYQVAVRLFPKNQKARAAMLVILGLMQMFGNVSIYTNETFLLTRTWQGKSVTGNLIIPMILWCLLWIFERAEVVSERNKITSFGPYFVLALTNMAGGICSSLTIFLGAMLIAIVAFFMMISERKLSVLMKCGLTGIPSAIYLALYFLLK